MIRFIFFYTIIFFIKTQKLVNVKEKTKAYDLHIVLTVWLQKK
jgi:hypothetical protein